VPPPAPRVLAEQQPGLQVRVQGQQGLPLLVLRVLVLLVPAQQELPQGLRALQELRALLPALQGHPALRVLVEQQLVPLPVLRVPLLQVLRVPHHLHRTRLGSPR